MLAGAAPGETKWSWRPLPCTTVVSARVAGTTGLAGDGAAEMVGAREVLSRSGAAAWGGVPVESRRAVSANVVSTTAGWVGGRNRLPPTMTAKIRNSARMERLSI